MKVGRENPSIPGKAGGSFVSLSGPFNPCQKNYNFFAYLLHELLSWKELEEKCREEEKQHWSRVAALIQRNKGERSYVRLSKQQGWLWFASRGLLNFFFLFLHCCYFVCFLAAATTYKSLDEKINSVAGKGEPEKKISWINNLLAAYNFFCPFYQRRLRYATI